MGREMQMQMQSRSWIPHHADLYLAVVGMEDPDWMRTLLIVASSREFLVLSCGSIAGCFSCGRCVAHVPVSRFRFRVPILCLVFLVEARM